MKCAQITKKTAVALIALTFTAAAVAGSARPYVDDNLDYVDPMVLEMAADAPEVFALPDGVEPYTIPAREFMPDVSGANEESGQYSLGDGDGPMVGDNYVRLYIGSHVNAGSNANYILMNFGRGRNMRLYGYASGGSYSFPRGWTLTWDLAGTVAEDYPQEMWDEISFWTNSGDGIQVARMMIVHSGVEILDWSVNRWLDAPSETTLGTAAMMLERKLEHVGNTDHAALNFAARELGKTNGYKYGSGSLWCSEFASWCLWKEGFWTPAGSIGTDDMKAWFSARSRLYTPAQVRSKSYNMRPGDYCSLWGGSHSVLFVEWVDSTTTITNATRFRTIEGNTGDHVDMRIRTVGDIDRVGSAQ